MTDFTKAPRQGHHTTRRLPLLLTILMAAVLAACSSRTEPVVINSEADVVGKTIAVPTGSIYDIDMSGRQDIKLERYTTMADMIAALKNGKADVFMNDDIAMSASDMRRHGVKIAFRSDRAFDMGYALRFDEADVVEQFNKFLAEAKESGLYDEICRRWMDAKDPNTVQMPQLEPASGTELKVATSFLMAPMCFLEGDEWKGLEIELLQRFARYAHMKLDIKYYDMAGASAALQTGKADLWSSSLFITEERKKSVLFTDPYYASHEAYYVLDEQATASKGLWQSLKDGVHNNLIVEDRWKFITDGLRETLIISICSLLLGTLLAALICWMRMSRRRWLQSLAAVYIDLMRGIPLLVLLMIMFYVVLAQTGLSATTVAVVSFSMVFAAYVSEMFRTAIMSVGQGQQEAGVALGFTPLQTFRYIILPQAARAVLPVYKGEAVSLFKNTSIVGYIAIQDLTKASDLIRSRTFDAFFPLIIITIIYFLLAWLLGKVLDWAVTGKGKSEK